MKHLIRTAICIFVLTVFISIKSFSQTVYVQETGKKYHTKNCSVAGNGKKGMTVAEAKKAGYTACKVCKPEEAAPTDKPKATEPKKTTPAVQPKKN